MYNFLYRDIQAMTQMYIKLKQKKKHSNNKISNTIITDKNSVRHLQNNS